MTDDRGWVAIHRRLDEGRYWLKEKFTKGQAWIDLIMLANHKETEVYIRGINIKLKRGELFWSEVELAKRWKWSREKTRNFLKDLSLHSEISRKIDNKIGVTTLINYDKYQNIGQQTRQQRNNKLDNKPDPNNNVNNVNNVNNKKEPKKLYENKTLEQVGEKTVEAFNYYLGTKFKDSKSFLGGLEKWLEVYSLSDIETAIKNIKYDNFWNGKMTPVVLFRKKNPQGEPVDYIGQLLNSKKENYVRR